MKKALVLILALTMSLALAACSAGNAPAKEAAGEEKPAAETQQKETDEPKAQKPEPIHDPIVFNGTGDDVLELDELDYYYGFHITGNADARHFAVTTYDSRNEYSELLVNTTAPYDGKTYDSSLDVRVIEVAATGDWTIEVFDLRLIDSVAAGETITGTGDSIVAVNGDSKTATVSGNSGARHFAVVSYDNNGGYDDLLVNTTKPYEGKVRLGGEIAFFVISAEGDWSITLQ